MSAEAKGKRKMRKSKAAGTIPMLLGGLLITGAVALTAFNLWSEYNAGMRAEAIVQLLPDSAPQSEEQPPAADPDEPMPVMDIDGSGYIGKLYVDDLGLELPVRAELDYKGLLSAPCRYKGSVYTDDIIIAAHNYRTHFGYIHRLTQGSPVSFVDVNGNRFDYVLDKIETIDGRNIEQMESGDWDLSLFTCNYRGNARITLRCSRVKQ